MTWIADLYQTYQQNTNQIGQLMVRNHQQFSLLPVGHAYRKFQIEVQITPDGEFFDARVLSKEEGPTIIPVTEGSSGRTNSPVPHPLHDGLKYVAGDFEQYVDVKKNNKKSSHELYMDQLRLWSEENRKVLPIYLYLKKKCLMRDLINNDILFVDKSDKLILKWTKELSEEKGYKPELFDVLTGSQDTAMIRFTVHDPNEDDLESPFWEDTSLMDSAIHHFGKGKKDIDYVTGETTRVTESHASGLRYGGDMAKIISANDSANFTFRGRFSEKSEVATIGFEVSQKAHNALKWLIMKQGIIRDGRVYLVWGESLPEAFTPLAGGNEFASFDDEDSLGLMSDQTQEEFAKLLKNTIYGRNAKLANYNKVNIIILDNATPGRIGILYYNSINQKEYLQRIVQWHQDSSWRQTYFVNKQVRHFFGAANLYDIARAAFGENANDKVLNNATTTLFTCVVEEKRVPFDLVKQLVNKASNPQSFDQNWKWQKTIEIACSMVNNYYFRNKGGCTVSLNKESEERNYLFGRLLAVCHVLEKESLKTHGSNSRPTNAERYMNAYSMHPVKTFMIIRENLQPYIVRLKAHRQIYYNKIFDEIMNQFSEKNYVDKALDGRYLLGYYSQEYDVYQRTVAGEEE